MILHVESTSESFMPVSRETISPLSISQKAESELVNLGDVLGNALWSYHYGNGPLVHDVYTVWGKREANEFNASFFGFSQIVDYLQSGVLSKSLATSDEEFEIYVNAPNSKSSASTDVFVAEDKKRGFVYCITNGGLDTYVLRVPNREFNTHGFAQCLSISSDTNTVLRDALFEEYGYVGYTCGINGRKDANPIHSVVSCESVKRVLEQPLAYDNRTVVSEGLESIKHIREMFLVPNSNSKVSEKTSRMRKVLGMSSSRSEQKALKFFASVQEAMSLLQRANVEFKDNPDILMSLIPRRAAEGQRGNIDYQELHNIVVEDKKSNLMVVICDGGKRVFILKRGEKFDREAFIDQLYRGVSPLSFMEMLGHQYRQGLTDTDGYEVFAGNQSLQFKRISDRMGSWDPSEAASKVADRRSAHWLRDWNDIEFKKLVHDGTNNIGSANFVRLDKLLTGILPKSGRRHYVISHVRNEVKGKNASRGGEEKAIEILALGRDRMEVIPVHGGCITVRSLADGITTVEGESIEGMVTLRRSQCFIHDRGLEGRYLLINLPQGGAIYMKVNDGLCKLSESGKKVIDLKPESIIWYLKKAKLEKGAVSSRRTFDSNRLTYAFGD